MLQVVDLTKTYGDRTLFSGVTFSLIAGERLGLVGRNGCGKSTLLRLILDEEHPDSGAITYPKGYRIGHLAQHLVFNQPSILKEACLGLHEDERDQEYRGEIILGGLGFSDDDMQRPASEFSGGFQIRINLAKLLLSEPDLLLLDEPTNYLDIVSMRWLSQFLRSWRGEMIIVSHDRLFMDSVTTHSMLIHRGGVKKLKGNTEKLYEQVAVDEEIYEKTRINEDKKRKEIESFVNRFRAQASKATLVQSRINMLERMGKKEELVDEQNLDFRFCEADFPGKLIAEAKELSFSYPEGPELIGGLSLAIGKRDRIGVVGKNGKGKSTLLRLLAGELSPTNGELVTSDNTRTGYFGQTNITRLDPKLTVEEEVRSVNPLLPKTTVRAVCGTMMFSGDDALKKIGVLSGGEKSRVLLGKIIAQPTNLLLLDEPTNHLDMESIEALMNSIEDYEGAVVIVTHSELILRQVINRLVVFQGDTPYIFNHDYEYFLEKEGWGEDREMSRSGSMKLDINKSVTAESVKQSQNEHSPDRRNSSEGTATKGSTKHDPKLRRKITAMESKIYQLEGKVSELELQLAEACNEQRLEEISKLGEQIAALNTEIEEKFAELEALTT